MPQTLAAFPHSDALVSSASFASPWAAVQAGITVTTSVADPSGGTGAITAASNSGISLAAWQWGVRDNTTSTSGFVSGQTYTVEVFCKGNYFEYLRAQIYAGQYFGQWFNLENGFVSYSDPTSGTDTVTPKATHVGNDWYLCQFSFVSDGTNVTEVLFTGNSNVIASDFNINTYGFVGMGISLWRFQIYPGGPRSPYFEATALNPADKTGTATFSNSNRTITSGADSSWQRARTVGGSRLPFYFEFLVNTSTANSEAYVTNGSQALGSLEGTAPNRGIAINGGGSFYSDNLSNYSSFTGTAPAGGDRIGVAVNPVTGKIWARRNNGSWNNSGSDDPATNTGGINISSFGSGPLYAAIGSNFTYISTTGYFSKADWTYAAPAGYFPLENPTSSASTLYTQSSGMQLFPVAAGAGSNYNESTAESVATSDSPASIATFPRSVAESIATADSQTNIATFPRSVAESVATADSQTNIGTFLSAVAESVATADSQTGGVVYTSSVGESAATSDSQTAALTVLGTVAESVATADTPAAIGTFTRSVAESTATSDTQSGIATYPASTAESVATSDSQAGGAAYTDSVGESVATADTTAATTTRVGSVAESIATADAQTSILTAVGSVAESVATADSQTNIATFTRAVAETMAAADAVADTGAALSETVATSDSTAGLVTSTNSVAESLAAADTTTATMVRTGAVAESVATADSQTNVVVFPRSVAESVATADTQTAGVIYLVACNENVATADAQSVFGSAQESVAESVAIADTVVSAGGVFTVSQTEVVTITDDVALYEFWDIITTGTGETWSDISSPATENWSGIATGSASWSNINTTPKTWDDITSTPETWTDIDAA